MATNEPEQLPLLQRATPTELMIGILCICAVAIAGSAAYAAYNTGDQLDVSSNGVSAYQTHNGKIRRCHRIEYLLSIKCTNWITVGESN